MSIRSNANTLSSLTKELLLNWEQTQQSWRDSKSEEFQRKYLAELIAQVDRGSAVFDDLDKLVQKVRHDCE
jgi:hypothetical protein